MKKRKFITKIVELAGMSRATRKKVVMRKAFVCYFIIFIQLSSSLIRILPKSIFFLLNVLIETRTNWVYHKQKRGKWRVTKEDILRLITRYCQFSLSLIDLIIICFILFLFFAKNQVNCATSYNNCADFGQF